MWLPSPIYRCTAIMPLTRHLYREDEVVASLMLCSLRGRFYETAFWCMELLDSGLADELILAARRTWLYGFGIGAPDWILAFEEAIKGEAVDADTILQLVVELARLATSKRHDSSVAVLMALTWGTGGGAAAQPDRVNAEEGVVNGEGSPLEQFLELAIWQGKALAAWGALRAFAEGEGAAAKAWDVLASLARKKHGTTVDEWISCVRGMEDLEEGERLAVALAAACVAPTVLTARWGWKPRAIDPDVTKRIVEWRELLGRRGRRAFAVQPDSIAWMTDRGRRLTVSGSNEKELWRLERPTGIWGSHAWDELAEEVGGWEAVRSDDAAREEFYDRFFPDDIPDEWSCEERAKSHGSGVLQKGEQPDLVGWFRNWFGGYRSAAVLDGMKLALDALSGGGGVRPADPLEFWKGGGAPSIDSWNLVPVVQATVIEG